MWSVGGGVGSGADRSALRGGSDSRDGLLVVLTAPGQGGVERRHDQRGVHRFHRGLEAEARQAGGLGSPAGAGASSTTSRGNQPLLTPVTYDLASSWRFVGWTEIRMRPPEAGQQSGVMPMTAHPDDPDDGTDRSVECAMDVP